MPKHLTGDQVIQYLENKKAQKEKAEEEKEKRREERKNKREEREIEKERKKSEREKKKLEREKKKELLQKSVNGRGRGAKGQGQSREQVQRPISSLDEVSDVESSTDSRAGSEAHSRSPEPIPQRYRYVQKGSQKW